MIDRKVNDIQAQFALLLGETITRYETAELLFDDGKWKAGPTSRSASTPDRVR